MGGETTTSSHFERQVYIHVVSVASSSVLLISGDVDDLAGRNGEVGISNGVSGTDLGALGVEGNGDGTTVLGGNSSTGIVNDRLVVLV